MLKEYHFNFPVMSFATYDGDQIRTTVDLGFNLSVIVGVRLADLELPKVLGRNRHEQEAGEAVAKVVDYWLREALVQGRLQLGSAALEGNGGYGGPVTGDFYFFGSMACLTDYLSEMGLARAYRGGEPHSWAPHETAHILDAATTLLDHWKKATR